MRRVHTAGSLVRLSKAPDFVRTPHTYTCVRAHTHTHTPTHSLALPSTLPSVEGGAFLELSRPEDLVSLQPSIPIHT